MNNVYVDPLARGQLTSEETNLYDRQIRLWGLDSQTRLHNARILLVGLDGLGAEIAKNIILAGVKSVTIVDNKTVSSYDYGAQFFVRSAEIGMNRVTVSLPRLRALNPMVKIIADTGNIDDKPAEYFDAFDVVTVVDCLQSQVIKINKYCRERNIKFMTGDVWGSVGYMFIDLIQHDYAEDTVVKKKVYDKSGEWSYEIKTITKKYTNPYIPFDSIINLDLGKVPSGAEIYYMVQIMQAYDEKHGRRSFRSWSEEFKDIARPILHKYKLTAEVMKAYVCGQLYAQLNPVCAIVGGIMGQEIIKIVSQKGMPHNNFFCFDAIKLNAYVLQLPYDESYEIPVPDNPLEVSEK